MTCEVCGNSVKEIWKVEDQSICQKCYEKDIRCKGCGRIMDISNGDDIESDYCDSCR